MKPPQRFNESETEWIDVEYNHLDQPYKETNQDGYVTLIEFDSSGREELVITKDGYSKNIYNSKGLKIKTITENGDLYDQFYNDTSMVALARNGEMLFVKKKSREAAVEASQQAMFNDNYSPEYLIAIVMASDLDKSCEFIQAWLEECEKQKLQTKHGHNI